MAYAALFVLLAFAELASLAMLFVFKNAMHAVLSLAAAFIITSLMFLVVEQPLLALLQLFVMVGGVATYLFVGVASVGISRFRHADLAVLAVMALASFAVIYYGVYGAQLSGLQSNTLSAQDIGASLSSSVALLYLLVLMLFGIGIATIALLRKVK